MSLLLIALLPLLKVVPLPFVGVYSAGEGDMEFPSSFWASDGKIYILDPVNGRVEVLDSLARPAGSIPLTSPVDDISVVNSIIYIFDAGNNFVYLMDSSGSISDTFSVPYSISSQFVSFFPLNGKMYLLLFSDSLYDFTDGKSLPTPFDLKQEGESIALRAFSCTWHREEVSLIQPLFLTNDSLALYFEGKADERGIMLLDGNCRLKKHLLRRVPVIFPLRRPVSIDGDRLYQIGATDTLVYIAIYRLSW